MTKVYAETSKTIVGGPCTVTHELVQEKVKGIATLFLVVTAFR